MTTFTRTHAPMTIVDIKNAATAKGYKFSKNMICDACDLDVLEAFPNGEVPVWVNTATAMKFYKKGKPYLVACPCGYRKIIVNKFVEKPTCAGCGSVISANANGKCFNPTCPNTSYVAPHQRHAQPANTQGEPAVPVKICNRVNCNNPVPPGRTAVCHSCQPAAKEPVSSKVHM